MKNPLKKLLTFFFKRTPTVNERLTTHWKILSMREYSEQTIRLKQHYSRIFSKEYGDRRLDEITRLELQEWLLQRAKSTPAHTRSVMIFIRDFYREAIIDGLTEKNPIEHIRLPRTTVRRKRLTREEFWRILNKLDEGHYLKLAIKLAITTAQRRADIVKMKFSDVWDDCLHIIQQKGMRKHPKYIEIPLTFKSPLLKQTLGEIIDECRKYSSSDLMIENTQGKRVDRSSLSTGFQYYRDNPEGVGEPSFHEIRSLAEREYKAIGVNTQALLGHTSSRMTDGYNDTRELPIYKHVTFPANTCSPPQ